MNNTQVTGKITRNGVTPTLTSTGKKVVSFTITDSRKNGKNPDGTDKYENTYWNVKTFQDVAEAAEKYLTAGSYVRAEGRAQLSSWTGKDNVERTSLELLGFSVFTIDENQNATDITKGATSDPDDDLFE